jgi:hypothetical protein
MALIKCKECGNNVSTKADKCPNCGAPVTKRTSGCALLAALLGGVFLIGFIGVLVSQSNQPAAAPPPSQQQADVPDKIGAWTMAEEFVKKSLKAPSTADFGSLFGDNQDPQENVVYEGSGNYRVTIWVDAQNSFGAKIRTHFILKLHDKGTGTWELLEGPTEVSR